jgi:hypothetical protein
MCKIYPLYRYTQLNPFVLHRTRSPPMYVLSARLTHYSRWDSSGYMCAHRIRYCVLLVAPDFLLYYQYIFMVLLTAVGMGGTSLNHYCILIGLITSTLQ